MHEKKGYVVRFRSSVGEPENHLSRSVLYLTTARVKTEIFIPVSRRHANIYDVKISFYNRNVITLLSLSLSLLLFPFNSKISFSRFASMCSHRYLVLFINERSNYIIH